MPRAQFWRPLPLPCRLPLPLLLLVSIAILPSGAAAGSAAGPPAGIAAPAAGEARLGREVEAYLRVPAVAGREKAAADFVAARLAGLPAQVDALGNVVVRLGSGEPRRLVVCPLGEPGFAVSRIQDDGYLRLAAVGPATGALWEQAHAGQVVTIGGERGEVPGAVALRSIHLQTERDETAPPLAIADAYVDVGAESGAEAAALGLRLLDPVALIRRPVRLAHGLIAAPAARVRAGCIAAVEAARALHRAATAHPVRMAGSVELAWTTLDLVNGAGLDYVLHRDGPFASAIDLGWGFGWKIEDGRPRPVGLPAPRSGLLADGALPGGALPGMAGTAATAGAELQSAPFADLRQRPEFDRWGSTAVVHLGLPALYPGSPVEAVALADVERLAARLAGALLPGAGDSAEALATPALTAKPAAAAGAETPAPPASPEIDAPPAAAALAPPRQPLPHEPAAAVLAALVARYGVSGAEAEVRAEVIRQLPAWARPATDAAGNLLVVAGGAGDGSNPVLFMAHLDEVGFRVKEVLADGRLQVERRGGVFPAVWEAQAAVVHGEHGDVGGVFEPRADWLRAAHGAAGELTVSVGAADAAEARALGIRAGSTVTMPKQLLRLGSHRAVGRSMDDRVGSSALLLALRQIDPHRLRRQVVFAWTVGEEVGLEGAAAIALRLRRGEGITAGAAGDAAPQPRAATLRVHPVDTFVSSDSPLESPRLADAPLGRGPVLRAMDSATYVPRPLIDRALRLAGERGIPIQVGRTGGATDGVPFIPLGAEMLPLSWPGRYSHSPVEVADLRDVENLVRLIVALAEAAD